MRRKRSKRAFRYLLFAARLREKTVADIEKDAAARTRAAAADKAMADRKAGAKAR
jgi:hypothetical protein